MCRKRFFLSLFLIAALFVGIGCTQQNFTVGIRYDLLYDVNRSTYASAWMPFVKGYFL